MAELNKTQAKIRAILNTDTYKLFEKESLKYLEDWQYFEAAGLDKKERYQLDKEAYIKAFFKTEHYHEAPFNELAFVKMLLSNIKKAEHPVFVDYREYLKKKKALFTLLTIPMDEEEIQEYLNSDLETRYNIHKYYYFKAHPKGNIERFHKSEVAYLKRQIDKYNSKEKVEPLENEVYASQVEILEYITSLMKSNTPKPIAKQKPEQEAPITFDELFYNTDLITPCIDILKELDPPLIDTDYNYIGRLKGVFCVWIDELQRQGIVKHFSDRKLFASLIPNKIKRFSIDESMFGKYQSRAEDQYRSDLKSKISRIKLSQDSH